MCYRGELRDLGFHVKIDRILPVVGVSGMSCKVLGFTGLFVRYCFRLGYGLRCSTGFVPLPCGPMCFHYLTVRR